MAESEKLKDGPPESPTTARELDFDDEDVPASPRIPKFASAAAQDASQSGSTETPPPQPPRPSSPRAQAESTLREAFPSINASVVKAVLMASGGQVEPAFNALLSMSDPDAQREPAAPPQPPRPAQPTRDTASQRQLEADELFARQLAEHYNNQAYGPRRDSSRDYRGQEPPRLPRRQPQTNLKPNELYDDRERSFIDDDLPVIRDSIKKGFQETQTKVNSFITNLRKKFEESDEEEPPPPPPRKGQQYGRSSTEYGRKSSDRDRYDADPEVLGDDFATLQLQDHEAPSQQRTTRPLANPDLFKSTPTTAGSERKISFQNTHRDTDNLYDASPDPPRRPASTGSRSKWQPLAAVDPDPVQEHDPFSLGDSDDEDSKKKDLRIEEPERLKKATAEAVSDSIGSDQQQGLEHAETTGSSGTKDKEATDKLTGKS